MTVLSWPAQLPRPERSTWNAQPQDARLRHQSDAGPPTYRRRFSNAAKTVTLSVLLSRDQKGAFDNFYQHDTKQGAQLFWMPDPTSDGWSLLTASRAPILTGDGVPILLGARWLCSFGDQLPSEAVVGVEFRKTFSVVVIP